MKNLVNAPYRIGTTGTLDEVEVHRLILTGLFGPVKRSRQQKNLSRKDTIRNKHSVFGSEVFQRIGYDCIKIELSRRD